MQEEARHPSLHPSQEDYTPATILTKQQLKSEAKPRDKRRHSTDDETPMGVQMPEDAAAADGEAPYSQKVNTKKYAKMAED